MAEVCYVLGRLLGCLRSDVCHAGLRSGFSQLTPRIGIPVGSFWMKKLSIHAFDSSRYAACTWLQHSLWFAIFWPNLPFGSLGGRHFHQSAARWLSNVPCRRGKGRRQCTPGLVIEATRHSVLFIDPQGEAFPLIGENTWAACRSRQEDLSCLDEFIGIYWHHTISPIRCPEIWTPSADCPTKQFSHHSSTGWHRVCVFCCFYLSRYLDHVANDDQLQCSRHSEHPDGRKVDYQQASRGKAWKRHIQHI